MTVRARARATGRGRRRGRRKGRRRGRGWDWDRAGPTLGLGICGKGTARPFEVWYV